MNKKLYIFNINGGIVMQTKNTVKVGTGTVITNDGIRMSYAEWIEMVNSER